MCNVMRVSTWVFAFVVMTLLHPKPASSEGTASNSGADAKTSDADLKMREYMVNISRQIGVTCNHCHNVSNFKSDKMSAYKISKHHMKLVDILNVQGMGGVKTSKVDCYMCHRGKIVPDYKEPTKHK